MRAACWHGRGEIRVERVPDPRIVNPSDAIVRVKLSGICGSDLHLYDGLIPTMSKGDIIGHEFMGEVVDVGAAVRRLRPGDRVVVPSIIGCGRCFYCKRQEWSLCDNSNPNAQLAEAAFGHSGAGIFGYSHLFGGYSGSHAEYVRVPYADYGPVKVPDGVTDEQALFASDAFPTGMMAAELCEIQPGDVIAIWGAGAVGQCAVLCAQLLGAERVIVIDRFSWRLAAVRDHTRAEVIDYGREDVIERLKEMTGGRGPDACIDAVGMEAHGFGPEALYDRAKQALRLDADRGEVLREAIIACRKGGVLSVVGVYAGFLDKVPVAAAFNKGLRLRMGKMHAQKYLPGLLARMQNGEVDPSYLVTHRLPLDQVQRAFELFKKKDEGCLKVLLLPQVTDGN